MRFRKCIVTGLLIFFCSCSLVAQHTQQPPQKPATIEVILLGTGFPRPDPDRAGPATAIIIKDRVFIVDAGRGIMLRYAATGLALKNFEAVFLTHLHSDHTSGLPDLFTSTWIFGRATPLQLYGPRGTSAMAKSLISFFAEDIHIRRDLTEMQPAAGANIDAHEISEGVIFQDADVKITAFLVDHRPVEPAFGYKFEAGGRSVVISGDTRPSANLIKFAKNTDLLIHEAYVPDFFERMHNPPDVAARLKAYHTTAAEAGEVAKKAGAKKLVITHVIGELDKDDERIRQMAEATYGGNVTVGKDLMRFRVE